MKMISRFSVALLAAAGFLVPVIARAQDGEGGGGGGKAITGKLVEVAAPRIAVQRTPDFTLKGATVDKRWRPKDWLEIETEVEVAPPRGDRNATAIPRLNFKYYVFLDSQDKSKRRILTADVVHTNVPVKEKVRSVVYITPSTILKVTGKPEGNPSLVTFWAVEVQMDGETVGFLSKGPNGVKKSPNEAGAKWWESASAPPQEPDLKNKAQTPFAPLWGDYHLDVEVAK